MQVFGLSAAPFAVMQVVVNRKRPAEALDAEEHRFGGDKTFSPLAEVRAVDEVIAGFVCTQDERTLVSMSRWSSVIPRGRTCMRFWGSGAPGKLRQKEMQVQRPAFLPDIAPVERQVGESTATASASAMESAASETAASETATMGEAFPCISTTAVAAVETARTVEMTAVESTSPEATVPAPGRIEAETKRAPVGAEADEGVIPHRGVPVPAGVEALYAGILAGDLVVAFSQILGTQAAPVEEFVLGRARVKVTRLGISVHGEGGLVVIFDLFRSAVVFVDLRATSEHQRGWLAGFELVEAGLHKLRAHPAVDDFEIVLRKDLIDFNGSAALEIGRASCRERV